jgi:hypothetical protein
VDFLTHNLFNILQVLLVYPCNYLHQVQDPEHCRAMSCLLTSFALASDTMGTTSFPQGLALSNESCPHTRIQSSEMHPLDMTIASLALPHFPYPMSNVQAPAPSNRHNFHLYIKSSLHKCIPLSVLIASLSFQILLPPTHKLWP